MGPLSGATTPGQSGPGSDGNEGVLRIAGTLPSDCLVSYQDTRWGGFTPLQRSSRYILGKNWEVKRWRLHVCRAKVIYRWSAEIEMYKICSEWVSKRILVLVLMVTVVTSHTTTLISTRLLIIFTQPLRSSRIWHKVSF